MRSHAFTSLYLSVCLSLASSSERATEGNRSHISRLSRMHHHDRYNYHYHHVHVRYSAVRAAPLTDINQTESQVYIPRFNAVVRLKTCPRTTRYGSSSSSSSSSSDVPAGSPSRGGDVAVYVFETNQPSLPTPFYSVLVPFSVFVAISNCIFIPYILPTALRFLTVLPVLSLPYCSFQLFISLYENPLQPIILCG